MLRLLNKDRFKHQEIKTHENETTAFSIRHPAVNKRD